MVEVQNISNPDINLNVNENGDRRMMIYSTSFGMLRNSLIDSLGMDQMKVLFLRYGYELGVRDAKKEQVLGSTLKRQLEQGPVYHYMNGYIQDIRILEIDFQYETEQLVNSVVGKGVWFGSFEAEEHIKQYGLSDSPICYTNVGYLNGYMSTICQHSVIAKEVKCIGMGHSKCEWVVKSAKYWDDKTINELSAIIENPVVEQSNPTYTQLLNQYNHLEKATAIHKSLLDKVSEGTDLQSLVDYVYETVKIPFFVQDTYGRPLAFSGISHDKLIDLELDPQSENNENISEQNNLVLYKNMENSTLISKYNQKRLSTPIVLGKQTVGFSSFIYTNGCKRYHDDTVLLDRITNAISLYLLNEKNKVDVLEKMKSDFLNDLLNGRQMERQEIIKRGMYINMDLLQPYHIAVLGYKTDHNQPDNNHILETISTFFNEMNLNVLISELESQIAIFFNEDAVSSSTVYNVYEQLIEVLQRNFKKYKFKIGISSKAEKIELVEKQYEEALLAYRMKGSNDIQLFEQLGVIAALISSTNEGAVQTIAHQILKPIYDETNTNTPLMKTLYVFLRNGGRLEQTALELSLSVSGLLYRVDRIEEKLNMDLRNPEHSHQLYIVLKALIALGELEVE